MAEVKHSDKTWRGPGPEVRRGQPPHHAELCASRRHGVACDACRPCTLNENGHQRLIYKRQQLYFNSINLNAAAGTGGKPVRRRSPCRASGRWRPLRATVARRHTFSTCRTARARASSSAVRQSPATEDTTTSPAPSVRKAIWQRLSSPPRGHSHQPTAHRPWAPGRSIAAAQTARGAPRCHASRRLRGGET